MSLLLAAAVGTSTAWAGDDDTWSAGLFGGLLLTDGQEVLGDSFVLAPRVGWWPNPGLGLELDLPLALLGRTQVGDHPQTGLLPNLGVVGRFFGEQPVNLLLGASLGGFVKNVNDDGALGLVPADGADLDFAALVGPGLLIPFGDLALRAEYREVFNIGPLNGTEDYLSNRDIFTDGLAMIGLMYLPMGPPDADKDGIVDDVDACMDQAEDVDGFEDTDGCADPDNDNDKVPDDADQCKDEAEDDDGFEDENGCPDQDNDGDGVPDEADQCRNDSGTAATKGCPDGDGDGLMDMLDECKDQPGETRAFGCPDGDGDRVPDGRDACPTQKAPDGIDARRDDGCPRKYYIAEDKIVILEQVKFLTGKATIQKSSYELLDGVSATLVKFPGVKLIQVEGHTDNQGADDANMKLSQARADSVKAYLVSKGVAAERLVAKGYGETKPVADNATPEGRQQNRRVEFNILEQDLESSTKVQ